MNDRLLLLDTKDVNQRHCFARSVLSMIRFLIKAASPPSYQSSLSLPPKFSTVSLLLCLPRLCSFLLVPYCASSAEAWKGGLHMVKSYSSPGLTIPLNICCL